MSVNYRAITLSSIVGKILDMVILIREESHLLTSDLQFSFKTGSSATMCTAMVQETVSCYVYNGSNVYGLLLDATQAFDKLNYCKLFSILLNRDVCPTICRLLLNMYLKQRLTVRWNSATSHYFNVTNGVKQGGVISPSILRVYMDGLLNELQQNGVGCHMGKVFAGAFAYADDTILLSPSVQALNTLLFICNDYASRYDVKLNALKSNLIVFRSDLNTPPDPSIYIEINGVKIKMVRKVIFLGHFLKAN